VVGYINSDQHDTQGSAIHSIPSLRAIDSANLSNFVASNAVSEVVVAAQNTEGITAQLYTQLIQLLENGHMIKEYTQVYESLTQRIPVQYVARDFYRYFPFSRSNQNHLYLIAIRSIDLIVGVSGLIIGTAILPFILIGNACANRGNLLYTQDRVGKNGQVFKIIKFRTMVKNAEANGAVFTTLNDSRVTPFGKFLRKARLDEFPQFYNIIKGEMSVIGPRPERPVFVNEIAETMPFYETRHIIKPGLTGWAQVNYAYGESLDDSLIKLQYDLYYIKHRSIFLDINICVKTLSTILFYRGQ
jgi:lipopolysaccharide/colanic/teichoic acid biosynthesis glycosyltransferase